SHSVMPRATYSLSTTSRTVAGPGNDSRPRSTASSSIWLLVVLKLPLELLARLPEETSSRMKAQPPTPLGWWQEPSQYSTTSGRAQTGVGELSLSDSSPDWLLSARFRCQ